MKKTSPRRTHPKTPQEQRSPRGSSSSPTRGASSTWTSEGQTNGCRWRDLETRLPCPPETSRPGPAWDKPEGNHAEGAKPKSAESTTGAEADNRSKWSANGFASRKNGRSPRRWVHAEVAPALQYRGGPAAPPAQRSIRNTRGAAGPGRRTWQNENQQGTSRMTTGVIPTPRCPGQTRRPNCAEKHRQSRRRSDARRRAEAKGEQAAEE